jgi:hypothetical protein
MSVTGSVAVIGMGPPMVNAVASPLKPAALSMVATVETAGVVVQVTDVVKIAVVRSEYVPVATNCWVAPTGMPALSGVTAMDTSVIPVTVNVVLPEISPDVAVIIVGPKAPVINEVASPLKPAALLMVAIVWTEELQVTDDVRSCVGPAVYVPVAINFCVVPRAILGLTGVTAMENSVAAVTVSVVLPEISPDAAVIVVTPANNEVASPLEPAALLMAATVGTEDVQVTDVVKIAVVAFEYRPVAINCWVVPRAILGLTGVTAMDTSVAAVTVNVVLPEIVPAVAVIVVIPTDNEVASPLEPAALLMVATAGTDELQITVDVRFCVVKSA